MTDAAFWLACVQVAINLSLVWLLAVDIAKGRRQKADERLRRIEEFLRFAKRPP